MLSVLVRLVALVSTLSISFLAVVSFICSGVSANPVLVEPFHGSAVEMIAVISTVNFLVDLFLLSLLLMIDLHFEGPKVGQITRNPATFVILVLLSAAAIAVAGAFVDVATLYDVQDRQYSDDQYYFVGVQGDGVWSHVPTLILGTTLIFATIYASFVGIVRVNWKVALTPSVAMALVSPISWIIIGSIPIEAATFLLVLLVAIVDYLTVWSLVRVHRKQFTPSSKPRPS